MSLLPFGLPAIDVQVIAYSDSISSGASYIFSANANIAGVTATMYISPLKEVVGREGCKPNQPPMPSLSDLGYLQRNL